MDQGGADGLCPGWRHGLEAGSEPPSGASTGAWPLAEAQARKVQSWSWSTMRISRRGCDDDRSAAGYPGGYWLISLTIWTADEEGVMEKSLMTFSCW
jgi:hypothetical protein